MSKSLGNFITIRELLETDKFGGRAWPGEVLRLAMLMTHYREPIDFTVKRLEEAYSIWRSFASIVRDYAYAPEIDHEVLVRLANDLETPAAIQRLVALRNEAAHGSIESGRRLLGSLRQLGFFQAAFEVKLSLHVSDELLSEGAVAIIEANKHLASDVPLSSIIDGLSAHAKSGAVVAAFQKASSNTLWGDVVEVVESGRFDLVLRLIDERLLSLKAGDFAKADRLRAQAALLGVQLMDSKTDAGERVTRWEIKR
jgi:cysteinyl-tRNA synthetase